MYRYCTVPAMAATVQYFYFLCAAGRKQEPFGTCIVFGVFEIGGIAIMAFCLFLRLLLVQLAIIAQCAASGYHAVGCRGSLGLAAGIKGLS